MNPLHLATTIIAVPRIKGEVFMQWLPVPRRRSIDGVPSGEGLPDKSEAGGGLWLPSSGCRLQRFIGRRTIVTSMAWLRFSGRRLSFSCGYCCHAEACDGALTWHANHRKAARSRGDRDDGLSARHPFRIHGTRKGMRKDQKSNLSTLSLVKTAGLPSRIWLPLMICSSPRRPALKVLSPGFSVPSAEARRACIAA